jgi:hypothetical protein
MGDTHPNIGNRRCDFRGVAADGAVVDEDPDGFVEFPDAFLLRSELQLSAKRDLEEALRDFVIGKAQPFRASP